MTWRRRFPRKTGASCFEASNDPARYPCLEVAQLVKRATLSLPLPLPEWFDAALSESGVDCLPVNPVLLHASIILPDLHRDPADRIIIATAQMHDAILVTADGTIQAYPGLRWIRKPSGE